MIGWVALLLLMQEVNGPVPQGRTADERPAPFPDVYEEMDRAVTPASREAMAVFAGCVLERSAERARSLLTADFTRTSYRNGLTNLSRSNEDCFRRTGERVMRATGLALAAAMAEHLIEQDPSPLNARLARAAVGKPARTYAPSDAAAMCVARSAPDDVARLFAAAPGSEAEAAAATALQPALSACARVVGSSPIETDAYGLRSIVATAAYRLLAAQES